MSEVRVILCLNGGSSSLKFALLGMDRGETQIAEGAVERIGEGGGRLWVHGDERNLAIERHDRFADHDSAVAAAMDAIAQGNLPAPDAIGHRVVHGGPHHRQHQRIDAALMDSLRQAVPFAPLHLPPEIRAIEAAIARYPELPQAACFDTAFFRDLPDISRRFPLPDSLYEKGVLRYGFHGLSYEHVVDALGRNVTGRVVVAHLGNGSSMAALRDGKPVDTTMGLTPTGGLMMGTRSGDLDPGVLVHLLDRSSGVRDVERIVNKESGLLGVSGTTSDMKTLLERRAQDQRAALAFEMFSYHARKFIGALAAALGGIDGLIFTGGIGQNAAPVRERICAGLEFLGIHVDRTRNRESAEVISSDGSPCVVRVIPADEERMIARHTYRLVQPPRQKKRR